MAYQLSAIDCANITEGNKEAVNTLLQRVKDSKAKSIMFPIGHFSITDENAQQLVAFMQSANIHLVKFALEEAQSNVNDVLATLKKVNSDIQRKVKTSSRNKRKLVDEAAEDDTQQPSNKKARQANPLPALRLTYKYGVNAKDVASEINHRITHPESINQGPILCCGVASLTTQILLTQPDVFQKMSWDLVQTGAYDGLPIPIEVDEKKLRTKGTPKVAEIFMNALNNCRAYIHKFKLNVASLDQMAQLAGSQLGLMKDKQHFQTAVMDRLFTIFANMPRQIVNLLRTFGFQVTKDSTSFTPLELLKLKLRKGEKEDKGSNEAIRRVDGITYSDIHKPFDAESFASELEQIQTALAENKHVILLLDLQYNNKLCKAYDITTIDDLPRLTHYTYLTKFGVDKDKKDVSLKMNTFGNTYHATDTLEEFQKGYRGVIISVPNK